MRHTALVLMLCIGPAIPAAAENFTLVPSFQRMTLEENLRYPAAWSDIKESGVMYDLARTNLQLRTDHGNWRYTLEVGRTDVSRGESFWTYRNGPRQSSNDYPYPFTGRGFNGSVSATREMLPWLQVGGRITFERVRKEIHWRENEKPALTALRDNALAPEVTVRICRRFGPVRIGAEGSWAPWVHATNTVQFPENGIQVMERWSTSGDGIAAMASASFRITKQLAIETSWNFRKFSVPNALAPGHTDLTRTTRWSGGAVSLSFTP